MLRKAFDAVAFGVACLEYFGYGVLAVVPPLLTFTSLVGTITTVTGHSMRVIYIYCIMVSVDSVNSAPSVLAKSLKLNFFFKILQDYSPCFLPILVKFESCHFSTFILAALSTDHDATCPSCISASKPEIMPFIFLIEVLKLHPLS